VQQCAGRQVVQVCKSSRMAMWCKWSGQESQEEAEPPAEVPCNRRVQPHSAQQEGGKGRAKRNAERQAGTPRVRCWRACHEVAAAAEQQA